MEKVMHTASAAALDSLVFLWRHSLKVFTQGYPHLPCPVLKTRKHSWDASSCAALLEIWKKSDDILSWTSRMVFAHARRLMKVLLKYLEKKGALVTHEGLSKTMPADEWCRISSIFIPLQGLFAWFPFFYCYSHVFWKREFLWLTRIFLACMIYHKGVDLQMARVGICEQCSRTRKEIEEVVEISNTVGIKIRYFYPQGL